MNAGGGGYYGALGIRALWIIGDENVWRGFTTIVRWSRGKPLPGQGIGSQGKKHRPLVFGVVVGLAMLISSIPFVAIRKAGTKVHFIVNGTLGCLLCLFTVILRWKKLSGTTKFSRASVDRDIQHTDDEATMGNKIVKVRRLAGRSPAAVITSILASWFTGGPSLSRILVHPTTMAAQNTGSTSLPSPTTPIPADASSLRCPESDLRVPEANLQPQAPPVTHTASRTGNSSELHRLVSYTHPYTPPDTPSSTTTEFFDLSPIDGDELQEHDVELEGRFDFLNLA
ncbi:hypothetical protein BU23DRAFT_637313 [Bimuria novae-zelandiae CBS 107.79]|uniref:Uncharacterized protein n=1 Tax=Bimuria novae-zelandiae CBS 107.79 TaxID=1447943 RepID=A0A6A5VQA6_9PLEO|nr:hypothetical protein BU23DRAFT_637313 [Bimuria novae-zelandiae CBS 107.79]